MASLQICGFESGDSTQALSTTGTFSVQGTTKRSGQYALRANPAAGTSGGHLLAGYSSTGVAAGLARTAETFYTWYARLAALPAATATLADVIESGGTRIVGVTVVASGVVTISGATTSATVATLVVDTWYRFDLRVTSNATSGLSINGATEQTCTAANFTQHGIELGRLDGTGESALDCYYDDLLISSTGFPGAGQVNRMDPDGNGSFADVGRWAVGTGITFAEVDDVPGHDSDTTYVAAAATDDNFPRTFSLESSSSAGVSGTIVSVLVYGVVRTDSISGTSVVALTTQVTVPGSGGVTATTGEWTTTYAVRAIILDVNPSGGAAWTSAGLDSLEVGASVVGLAQIQRITKVAAMVWSSGAVAASDDVPVPLMPARVLRRSA